MKWLGLHLLLAGLLTLAACQGGGGLPDGNTQPGDFTLLIDDDTYFADGAAEDFRLTTATTADGVDVTVAVEGAAGLTTLIGDLAYDHHSYTPRALEVTGALHPDGGEVLSLPGILEKEPGLLSFAQALPWPDRQAGLNGDAELLVIHFTVGESNATRSLSAVPTNKRSQSTLSWDSGTGELSWYYFNSGDFNVDSYVSASDMIQVAMFHKRVSHDGNPFDESSPESVVDYDRNGEINSADMTAIALNFESMVSLYNIYTSTDPADYPAEAGDPNGEGATLLGTVNFNDYTTGTSFRMFYTFTVSEPIAGAYYWVRPSDATNEGIASTLVGGSD